MVHLVGAERVQRLNLPVTAYTENVERFDQATSELLQVSGDAIRHGGHREQSPFSTHHE
jgi:hypothetical protein